MPVQTDTLYNIPRLNVMFAVSAAILAVASLWLVMDDYNRPWKQHQNHYMEAQAAIAHLQYVTTQQSSFQDRLREVQARVSETSRQIDPQHNAAYGEMIDEQTALQARLYDLDLTFKQKDAWIVVTRTHYEQAMALYGPDAEETQQMTSQLADEQARLAVARRAKEEVEEQLNALNARIKSARADHDVARKELDSLLRQVEDAKNKRDQHRSFLRKTVFNFPLLDFAAPKGAIGRHEIKQVVAQDVKTKLNFMEGYKVDRCTTCHVVIDNDDFTQHSLVSRFEAAIPAIQEQLSSAAELGPVPMVRMPEPPGVFGLTSDQITGRVADVWERLSKADQQNYFERLQSQINSYLDFSRLAPLNLGQPMQAHPQLDLFLTPDSPHPLSQMGCTVCHEGNGQETDFVFAAHTPKTPHEREAWAEKYYDTNLGVPTMTWSTLEHFWDFPMIPPRYSEAGCTKCHSKVDDIATFQGQAHGEKIKQGQKYFKQLGCINCHKVEDIALSRRVGTHLAHVGDKLSDGFMHNWIYNPRAYRPASWMPHFFMQENNGPGSQNRFDADPIRRTRTEVLSITHYLRTVSEDWQPEEIPAGREPEVSAGQQLFGEVGCLACHANMQEYGQHWIVDDLAHSQRVHNPARGQLAELRDRAQKLQDQADAYRQAYADDPRLEDLDFEQAVLAQKIEGLTAGIEEQEGSFADQAAERFSEMDLNAQVKYAMLHLTEERRAKAEEVAEQEQLLAAMEQRDADPLLTYVPPVFTRFAPELSGVGSKVSVGWLYSWLRNPRHYAADTKMPRLRLTEQEALDLAAYLKTLQHDSFDMTPFAVTPEVVAELDSRMDDLLLGQNSEASVQRLKNDEDGLLSRQLVETLSNDRNRARRDDKKTRFDTVVGAMDLTQRKMLFVGQKMITHYGCYACHDITGFQDAARPGTEVSDWGEKNLHQLDFAFFGNAYHHTLGETEEFKTLYPNSREDLIQWSSTGNAEVEVAHTHASFATHKMLNPRIWDRKKVKKPYEKLKMPNFYLTEEEAEALVTYMLSRRPARVADSLQIDYEKELAGPIAAGRNLAQELNCTGCHRIEDNVATVHQYITVAEGGGGDEGDDWGDDEWDEEGEDDSGGDFEDTEDTADDAGPEMTTLGARFGGEFDVVNAPPWLRGQGAKVQPDWLHKFLLNVFTLRPWDGLKVRMPSFYLTNDQSRVLVDYFAALSKKEAEDLEEMLDPIQRSLVKSADPLQARSRWHEVHAAPKSAQLLADYALDNEILKKRDFDLTNKDAGQIAGLYGRILSAGEFFEDLYDVEYPFEFDDYQTMSTAQFDLAEQFFHELRCLSCHVLGDPMIPGSNAEPSAPNLALANKRLRYEWFRRWLQEPAWIQPGTKMPQWFPGGKSAFSETMGYGDDLRLPLESKYTADGKYQMRLLMDFIWQAGQQNYTVIDPARGPQQPVTLRGEAALQVESDRLTGETIASAPPAGPAHTFVLSGPITNQTSIGPRPRSGTPNTLHAGAVMGQVVWRGAVPPETSLPVSAAHADACAAGGDTRALKRLTLDPQSGGVQNAVVYLAGDVPGLQAFELPADMLQLRIQNCNFSKRILVARQGSILTVSNRDDVTHHIRGRLDDTLLWSKNLESGADTDITLDRLGIIEVRSGTGFEWMNSTIWVVDHAGYALSDARGNFVVNAVPPGEYTLHVWHPGIAADTSQGGDTVVDFGRPLCIGGLITVTARRRTEVVVELR